MKRAAILSITAFYLLLISGMFVCSVHCAAAKVITKDHGRMCCLPHHTKSNGKKDCCNSHNNYVLKENLKPGTGFKLFKQVVIISTPSLYKSVFCTNIEEASFISKNINRPPWKSGRSIIIQFHSFLI